MTSLIKCVHKSVPRIGFPYGLDIWENDVNFICDIQGLDMFGNLLWHWELSLYGWESVKHLLTLLQYLCDGMD